MELHVVPTEDEPATFVLCPGYLCDCPDCSRDRFVAVAQAGRRDKPQPWQALERAA